MSIKLRLANATRALRYLTRTGCWCRHPYWGPYWPCNYGADELRLCLDCDRVEKRPAETRHANQP